MADSSVSGSIDHADPDQPPPPKLLEKALMMPNFQALAASLEGADAQSDEGRRQMPSSC